MVLEPSKFFLKNYKFQNLTLKNNDVLIFMIFLGKFLMVQEPLGVGGGYWLPAGRVDPREK